MPIWMMRSARVSVSACASVLATTNSHPCKPAEIMLLTALPPAPPTPNTVMCGLSSRMSGIFRFMLMVASSRCADAKRERAAGSRPVRHRLASCGSRIGASEALPQPLPDPREIGVRPRHQLPRVPRFAVFEIGKLGVHGEPGRDCKGRPLRGFRQSGKPERAADAHLALEDARGKLGQPVELAGAAGEHYAAALVAAER